MQLQAELRTVSAKPLVAALALAAALAIGGAAGYALHGAATVVSQNRSTVAQPAAAQPAPAAENSTTSLSGYPYVMESQPNGDLVRPAPPAADGFPYTAESQPDGDVAPTPGPGAVGGAGATRPAVP